VKTMAMGRSSSRPSGGGASPRLRSPTSRASGLVAGSVRTSGASPVSGARSSVVTTRRGPAARNTAARSAGTSLGLTAAVTAPSLAAAT
jgi:hypothetical protein